jgi:hypothetical protein
MLLCCFPVVISGAYYNAFLQEKMLRTWIQYNRPSEPNFTHAGLLLAFGLHEHLRVLTMTDAYRYLSQVTFLFFGCLCRRLVFYGYNGGDRCG